MEQGVYSEETKGDFDAAIQFYHRSLRKPTPVRRSVRRRNIRLAMCYDKKKDRAAAAAAFTKLIPRLSKNQKELVALANEHLGDGADLLPVPWVTARTCGSTSISNPVSESAVAHYSVASDEINGRKIWRFRHASFRRRRAAMERMEADAIRSSQSIAVGSIPCLAAPTHLHRCGRG